MEGCQQFPLISETSTYLVNIVFSYQKQSGDNKQNGEFINTSRYFTIRS